MRKFFILSLITCTSFACSGQKENDGVTIKGEIKYPLGAQVRLQKYAGDSLQNVALINVTKDNTFSYTSNDLEPGIYRLNFFDKQFVSVIINNDDIEVNVDGNMADGKVEINGSTEMDHVERVGDIQRQFQEQVEQMNARFTEAVQTNNSDAQQQIRNEYDEAQRQHVQRVKTEIDNMGASLAVLHALSLLDPEQELQYIDSVVTELQKEMPRSEDVQRYADQIGNLKKLAVGSEAPDFTLTNPDGEEISLSSFRGDYLLLDFWAAWCRPCRIENPNLVRAYKEYNEDGFEIFGVSLDQNDESWEKAIEQDGLLWKQVRDAENKVASIYNVTAIPMNFLLDKEGKIIAKNLRGEQLEEKLKELF